MQLKLLACSLLFMVQSIVAQKVYQLAPPIPKYASVFFQKEIALSFDFKLPGSSIHYTTDGTEPIGSSAVYTKPLSIKKHLTVVKAKSFATGFSPSETVSLQFFAQGYRIASIATSAPNNQYKGNGPTTLTDNQSGGMQHTNPAWLGFDSDSIVVDLSLEKTVSISQVMLHVLVNQGGWIFLPQQAEVYAVKNNMNTLLLTQPFNAADETPSDTKALLLNFSPTTLQQLRIVIHPLASLPDWHAGKGKRAWCFLDEIKIY